MEQRWSALTFVADREAFVLNDDDVVVWIPSNMANRQELFAVFAQALSFPTYFGNNWDALYDFLCDLSWVKQRRIVIVHADLPLQLGRKGLQIYIELLIDSVQDWKPGEAHELAAVFPLAQSKAIQELLES